MRAPRQTLKTQRKEFASTIGGFVQSYNAGLLTDMDDELDLIQPGKNFGSKFMKRPCKNYKTT